MAGGFLFKYFALRPIERILMDVVSSLNDTELLAVLIGSGLQVRSAETVAGDLLTMKDYDLTTPGKLTPDGCSNSRYRKELHLFQLQWNLDEEELQ